LILVGLNLIILTAVGVLAYNRLSGANDSLIVSKALGQETTARSAFPLAAELAAQWREDAQLASVSGRWAAEMKQQGKDQWTFQFFSPSASSLALFVVADGEARQVRESLSPYNVPTFSLEEWRVDSDQALQVWWDQGGDYLLERRPDAELAIQLRVPEAGSEIPVWTIVGMVFEQESVFTVQVDAVDGEPIEP